MLDYHRRATAFAYRATWAPKRLGIREAAGLGPPKSFRDSSGALFRGTERYRLRVPADTPAHDFWSIIAYEVGTNAFIHNPENRVGVSSDDKDLFAALNVATGEVLARCKPRHRATDFVAFLREIEASVEPSAEVHVVLDNLSAHRAPVVHRWLLRHSRFHLHFTPTYASWLNLVERFFGLLTEKALRRGSHTSVPQLREAILVYVGHTTRKASPSSGRKPPTRSSTRSGDLVFALNRYMDSDQTFVRNHRSRTSDSCLFNNSSCQSFHPLGKYSSQMGEGNVASVSVTASKTLSRGK